MSHELEIGADGSASMVWADTVPWHGLGTKMDPKEGALAWMKAANLDWKVSLQPMFTTLPDGQNSTVCGRGGDEYKVLVRDQKGKYDVFGPVGPDWVPVQNQEVFDFLEKFCKAGSMKMDTCGSLKGGTEIWALARFMDDFEIVPGDEMKGYLLFHMAHVWGKGNQLRLTPVRVVCNNTLTMAIGGSGRKKGSAFHMPHIRAFDGEVQKSAINALGLAGSQIDGFREQAIFLTKKKATDEEVQEFIAQIYQPKLIAERELTNDNSPMLDQFSPSAENVWEAVNMAPGCELKGSKGTWWGAFNGVTYFEDHLRISYQDATNVLGSAWFGSGNRRKTVALEIATEYAKAA